MWNGNGHAARSSKAAPSHPTQMYAVKTISAETLHRNGMDIDSVEKEVKVLTSLHHPHVVRSFKFLSENRHFTDEDGEASEVMEYHMIMELAAGGSLADVIKGSSRPATEQVVTSPHFS